MSIPSADDTVIQQALDNGACRAAQLQCPVGRERGHISATTRLSSIHAEIPDARFLVVLILQNSGFEPVVVRRRLRFEDRDDLSVGPVDELLVALGMNRARARLGPCGSGELVRQLV